MSISDEEWEAAVAAGEELLRKYPHAVAARYDAERHQIVVGLSSGAELAFAPDDAQGLEGASVVDLEQIEISPAGLGLHWPALDADLWVPGLIDGVFGSRAWTAAREKSGRLPAATVMRAEGEPGARPRKAV